MTTFIIIVVVLFFNFQAEIDAYGIDPDGPAPSEEWDGPINDDVAAVEVPSTECPLQMKHGNYYQLLLIHCVTQMSMAWTYT